jgi:transformation/transcription domain-associated protein
MNELTTPQSSPLRHIVNEDKMSSPPTNILTSPIAGKKRKQPDPPTESDDIVENTKKASTAPTPTPTPSMSTSKLDPEPDSNQDKQKGEKQEQEQETVEKFKISNEEDVDKSVKDGSKDTIMEDASITEKQPDSKIQSSGDVAMKEPEKSGDVAMKDVDEEKTGEEQKIHQDIPDKEDTTPKVIPKKPEKINWIDIRAKLLSKDSKLILKILSELRDNFELLHSEEYPTFLATLLPVFDTILKKLPYTPSNQIHSDDSSSSERSPSILESNQCSPLQSIHLIRYSIVELCSVLPHNEILRPFAAQIMKMVLEVLRMDYEEIAFIASKIISELHKNYRDILSEYAEPYLNFVFMSYRLLKGNVQKNLTFPELSINDNNQVATTVTKPNFGLKAAISFRILTECPLTVFLILQLYPKYIKKNLMQLLPLMMEALGQKPPPPPPLSSMMPQQVKTSKEGDDQSGEVTESQNQHYLETIKKIYYKRARELLTAQVKTLTFVTFLLPRYREQMKKDEDHLASSVLALFQMCPRDAISTRKDLLVALKHIFVTDFRRGFYKHFDLLLDDRVLIGRHKQSEHTHLRVDAYGALATLIPHVCPNLSLIQISRVVHLYSRVLHDASLNLPLKSQMMSVNLLLSLVDTVYKNTESRASMGRDILYRILENLVGKISYLADGGAESIMETEKNRKTLISATNKEVGFFDRAIDEEKVEYYRTKREEIYENYLSDSQESLENVKKLVRLILPGLKNLVFCISHYGVARKEKKTKSESDSKQPPTSNQHSAWYEEMAVQSMSLSEQRLIDKFLVSSLKIVHLFKDNSAESPTTSEHQNALDAIATALAQMDSYTFQRIVGPRVDIIFEAISVNPDTIIIVQKLLIESEHISTAFAICLIKFLMEIIKKDFAGKEKTSGASQALKQMFESFFVSLATCRKNEAALRPHLQSLVAICLRRTTNCNEFSWPGIYLEIIRGLFRSVAGGKFEESYKEILPLLSPLINGLYRIFNQTENVMMRKVLIELCLTVPARLSSLLPHLSLLLRVIVPALRTNEGELINLGYVLSNRFRLPISFIHN